MALLQMQRLGRRTVGWATFPTSQLGGGEPRTLLKGKEEKRKRREEQRKAAK